MTFLLPLMFILVLGAFWLWGYCVGVRNGETVIITAELEDD